ncbi:hypothetical protein GPS57_09295 [Acinetobacter haemolyticus]|uniref:virulence factor TspB C-terminal domain-related protein n=1 Tax=Acinetobacter haemolyticus TaxID=29430 RepID=UPI001372FF31|nr:virulence factor TspB C-terminal domain-related protein [Acinetobacter haemolyticus]NAR63978.1 hypothetical protein [Acinetobacter haemolyticus]NAR63988.1 hypothetical protein [Acinetobacter haemolyticus]
MKKIIVFLLSLTIALSPSIVWASAAEKWDYEVKPDTNQRLKVTGHKVDQFGDAVNDKKYTTTIDPKTTANKQKMGGVGIAKLLKKANWASAGVEAFQALLEGIDWVMDLEAQSIWRYKTPNDDYSCKYLTPSSTGGDTQVKEFYADDGTKSLCPIDIAIKRLDIRASSGTYPAGTRLEFVKWDPVLTPQTINFRFQFSVLRPEATGMTYEYYNVPYKNIPYNPPVDKEYLTPEQAADYANHTHPDYTNPKYAERANPLYKPEIQENLWKPHNEWERLNSPTVQEAIRQLEVANPDAKDDTIKENEPNPETGEKSFSLPAFCNWATAVCDYFEWAKQEPELEKEEIEIQEPKEFDNSVFTKDRFQVSRQCPVPEQHTITLSGVSVSFSFDMTPLCTVLEMARPALVACSYLYAAYIVIGAARNG